MCHWTLPFKLQSACGAFCDVLCCVQGVLKGFKGELMHVFNKNENYIHQSDYFEQIEHRDNFILMGDSLGDLRMVDGAAECSNKLTVGFLNDKVLSFAVGSS